MLFKEGAYLSSLSHFLEVASISRSLLEHLFSWYCGKCDCSKLFFLPLFFVVSWFVSSNLKFDAEEKGKNTYLIGNQTINYLQHSALTANPSLEDFL